jgi:hypothetical protein
MRVDVVHQKIDQPAPCLQHRQKADDLCICLICARLNRHWSGCLGGSASGIGVRAAPGQDRDQCDNAERQRATRQIRLECACPGQQSHSVRHEQEQDGYDRDRSHRVHACRSSLRGASPLVDAGTVSDLDGCGNCTAARF